MITPEPRHLIHALVHIEFNAINLALDAIWRFADMPQAYYADWLQVADEERCISRCWPTICWAWLHLWRLPRAQQPVEMAAKTQHDILARIALVPRTMEARGLDVVPSLRGQTCAGGRT